MVVQYKCPSCGADMAFDSTTGTLHCDSCGKSMNIEEMDSSQADSKESHTYKSSQEEGKEAHNHQEEVNEYQCNNCGAVLITDKDTAATTCSFCGAGVVLTDRLSGNFAPSLVIPFSINKEQAQEAFKKWCRKGLLTPKGFMSANRIKSMTGIYAPFWLYDLNGLGTADATCTKVRTYEQGDYIYTETDYFHVHRKVSLNYLKVPTDASEKMDDKMMDKLEPYHYQDLKDFQMPYLAGYLAEKYNYDSNDLFHRVESRVQNYVDNYISQTINGYATTAYNYKDINIRKLKAEYALFPIWMVCYDYKKSEHTFAMNGQTGKIVGRPPLSAGKIAAWFSGISAAAFLIMKLIAILSGGPVI